MKLSRRDRGALIVLLSGAIALTVDKLLLPPPDAAAAGEVPAGPAEPTLVNSLDDLLASTPPPAPEPEWSREPIQDVFALSRLAALHAGRDGDREESACELFLSRHSLQATILGPRSVALVGRRKLHVGDVLDGFVLESITEREALFVSDDGQRAVLRVARGRQSP